MHGRDPGPFATCFFWHILIDLSPSHGLQHCRVQGCLPYGRSTHGLPRLGEGEYYYTLPRRCKPATQMQSKGNVGRLELRDSIGVVLRAVRSDVPGTASSSSRFARHGHGATVTRKSRDWSHSHVVVVLLLVQVPRNPPRLHLP